MKVLVYGASGSQMRPLIPLLLARGHHPFVLTRKVSGAELHPTGTTLVTGDLADAGRLRALSQGMDAVTFMLPAFLSDPHNALEYVANAAQAAAAAGVKLMVWNTSGRYPLPGEPPGGGAFVQSIHAVLESAGIPLIAVAPAKYMENLLGPWTLERIPTGKVAYPVLAARRMGWIACRDVCALIAAALERPQLAGRLFRISGPEALTGPELAGMFAAVLQRPFEYETLTPQQMKASLEAAFGAGAGDEVAAQYALDQSDPDPPATHYEMAPVLNELPVQLTPVRHWIQQHRAVFLRA
jgi:uncharacterized protein YbjT (DUF2867 family)